MKLKPDNTAINIIKQENNLNLWANNNTTTTITTTNNNNNNNNNRNNIIYKFYEITNRCSYMQSLLFHC